VDDLDNPEPRVDDLDNPIQTQEIEPRSAEPRVDDTDNLIQSQEIEPRSAEPRVDDLDNTIQTPLQSDSSSSSSSSSDSDIPTPVMFTRHHTEAKEAEVEVNGNKAPILTSRSVSPEVLRRFENACRNFFHAKKIAANEQVASVAGNMHDALISDWYWTDEARINGLSFEGFIKEMKVKWLKKGWELAICRHVLGTKQNGEVFWEWAVRMRGLNALLRDTASHLTDDTLRNQLDANLDTALSLACDDEKVYETTELEKWLGLVKDIDEMKRRERQQARADAEEAARNTASKRSAATTGILEPSRRANNQIPKYSNVPFSSQNAPNTEFKQTKRVAKLTDEERAILRANGGCLKCRCTNAGHLAKDCPEHGPVADVKHTANATENLKGRTTSKPVAAVIGLVDENSASTSFAYGGTHSRATPTPHVEIVGSSSFPIAAIMPPPNESSVLEGDENSDDESVSLNNIPLCVTPCPCPAKPTSPFIHKNTFLVKPTAPPVPLSVPHLRWRAAVADAKLGCPNRRIIDTFLDCGSHLVLINESLVNELQLHRHKLHKPIPKNLALLTGKEPKNFFEEWTKIKLYDPENNWAARSVHAVIAPALCTDVLLGLPFLSVNNLVTDYCNRTCIDKVTGFDLMNPKPPTKPPEPKPKLRKIYEKIMSDRKEMLNELATVCSVRKATVEESLEPVMEFDIMNAVCTQIEQLSFKEELGRLNKAVKEKYKDVFRPIPHISELPEDVYCHISLKDASKTISTRSYSCPRKYRDAWKTLLEQHLEAGRIWPSSSTHASPAFIIPKADTTVLPRWVNDYCQLNGNTIHDRFPLPRVNDILANCGKSKIWSVIDMTNSFFQTRVHPDDVGKTAVTMPFGLYEWLVMPMGLKNAPAIHQRRVVAALREYIGTFCHVYLDDIIIWSDNVKDHVRHIDMIMNALRKNKLYCNPKKSEFFVEEVIFLGHKISRKGIEACNSKVDKILTWPRPTNVTEVRGFLGLVRYLAVFLPKLAELTNVLNPLTSNTAKKRFPTWTPSHEEAFEAIKQLVVGRECLTVINHNDPGNNKIFVTCDASDHSTGAVLSWGESWETARLVTFESRQLKNAEMNYPVHEKELLAVIRALKKWRTDLLGSHFFVYTDHRTLTNFETQKDLSRRQARWQEYLSQFELTFVYIRGEDNTVADALSRRPPDEPETLGKIERHRAWRCADGINAVVMLEADTSLLNEIKGGYKEDEYCKKLKSASAGFSELNEINGLWYIGNRLIVPRTGTIREDLFRLAHDTLGHFGAKKSYAALHDSYYWPGMQRDLELSYIPACIDCQRNKSSTSKPRGPLHPLPVPDKRNERVAMDFIGPLLEDDGYNCIMTMTDTLGSDIRIIPTTTELNGKGAAELFFNHWFCENGLPDSLVCDRDKLFVGKFWRSLCKLSGIRLRMSTSYHPETDGSSERMNKTVNQMIRYHVQRNQKGWAKALPLIRFQLMNTINASTSYSGFELQMGHSP
jgi:hypothetical protein